MISRKVFRFCQKLLLGLYLRIILPLAKNINQQQQQKIRTQKTLVRRGLSIQIIKFLIPTPQHALPSFLHKKQSICRRV